MRLTQEDHDRVRQARARVVQGGGSLPAHRSRESASERGGGANPAFIRLPPRPTPTPLEVIAQHVGARLRLTWPGGYQRVGDVGHSVGQSHGLKPGVAPSEWDTFGGTVAGGELLDAVKIERRGPNGRYTTIWQRG